MDVGIQRWLECTCSYGQVKMSLLKVAVGDGGGFTVFVNRAVLQIWRRYGSSRQASLCARLRET